MKETEHVSLLEELSGQSVMWEVIPYSGPTLCTLYRRNQRSAALESAASAVHRTSLCSWLLLPSLKINSLKL